MIIILQLLTTVALMMQNVFQKIYNRYESDSKISMYAFTLIQVFFAFVVYVPMLVFSCKFPGDMFIYALGFAVSYFCALYFNLRAIDTGSLSLTSLVVAYSLIIPTLYGVFFQDGKIKFITIIGIILLGISICFITSVKGEKKISGKWLVNASLAFLGNGFCTTIQRMYQLKSGGECKSEFMVLALGCVIVALMVAVLSKEKKLPLTKIKNGGCFAALAGLSNGIMNMLVMMLVVVPSYILYPTISGGSIVLTFIVSQFFFKEELDKMQKIGFAVGVASVIILNL